MSSAIRNRLSLWLRSERAQGLGSVALPRSAFESGGARSMAPPPPARPMDSPPVREPPFARRATAGGNPAPPTAGRPLTAGHARATASPPAAAILPPPDAPFDTAVMSTPQKKERLAQMSAEVNVCVRCQLHAGRTHAVFGEGDPDAELMFIGEGPGQTEDETGRPFVGRAGGLLERMIKAMGLRREQVFIANIVKCRPPGNRAPAQEETAACTPFLLQQIEIVRPKVIVTLGLPATQFLLQTKRPMRELRGRWHEWRGIRIMPTYHPAYILRYYTEQNRQLAWSDLQQVMAELKLPK